MKLTLQTKDLKAAFSQLASVPSHKGPSSVSFTADPFGGLLLQRNTGIATMRLECIAEVDEEGKYSIGFDAANAIIPRIIENDVSIQCDEKGMVIRAGSSKSKLQIWPGGEIEQELPEVDTAPLTMPAKDLLRFIKAAAPAAYTEGGRDNLKGVCIRTMGGKLIVFAADGRRAHVCFGEDTFEPVLLGRDEKGNLTDFDAGILLDKSMIGAIEKVIGDDGELPLHLCVSERGAQVEVSNRVLRFLMSRDVPPNLEKFLTPPDSFNCSCRINREKLLSIARRATVLGDGVLRAIVVSFVENGVSVEAKDANGNTFSDFLEAKPTKFPVNFRVNGAYFQDFLDASKMPELDIGYLPEYKMIAFAYPEMYCLLAIIHDVQIEGAK